MRTNYLQGSIWSRSSKSLNVRERNCSALSFGGEPEADEKLLQTPCGVPDRISTRWAVLPRFGRPFRWVQPLTVKAIFRQDKPVA